MSMAQDVCVCVCVGGGGGGAQDAVVFLNFIKEFFSLEYSSH